MIDLAEEKLKAQSDLDALSVIAILGRKLDNESDATLWGVYRAVHFHPVQSARILFPNAPKGYVNAAKNIGHYCVNRYIAHEGSKPNEAVTVGFASVYAPIAERIYNRLPDYAKTVIR